MADGRWAMADETVAAYDIVGAHMPFKSQAQRRKFAELLVEGKISPETYEEWNRETGSAKLPDRVKKKATASQKAVSRKRVAKRASKGRRTTRKKR
jgi:hypothetical protein